LKRNHNKLLQVVAFNFNLRRYSLEEIKLEAEHEAALDAAELAGTDLAAGK